MVSSLQAGELRSAAEEAVLAACEHLGLAASRSPLLDERADLRIAVENRHVEVAITAMSSADRTTIERRVRPYAGVGPVPLLVADRITSEARAALSEAGWGWLDRRGFFHLASTVRVHQEVPGLERRVGAGRQDPISGRGAMSVAFWLCQHPGVAISPRAQFAEIGFSPATISKSVSRLAAEGLVDDRGASVGPELFWALADRWRPEWIWLATDPDPSSFLDPIRGATTWRVTGTAAALRYGAPIASPVETAHEFYVRGPVETSIAVRRYGSARPGGSTTAIAVPPVRAAVPEEPALGRTFDGWTLAEPLAVALDLAQDRSRGRQILEEWDLGDGVWR